MVGISTVIKEIIEENDAALQMLRADILNLSSYARSIHQEVEKRTYKEVKLKSLIVALSRLAKTYSSEDPIQLKLQNLSVHANLVDLSFEKTKENLIKAERLMTLLPAGEKFFTLVQGITEITLIADVSLSQQIKKHFHDIKPLSEIADLAGITVKADISYTKQVGVFYTLLRSLQMKKINIVEIVSTSTEMTFILDKKDVQAAVSQLSKFLA